ncbi:MAG: peptidylprolyl isomerase [Bdellovibrionales bacterium]|nr:peptidylprolyl isomerase [Bdellovibrionales bacterium]
MRLIPACLFIQLVLFCPGAEAQIQPPIAKSRSDLVVAEVNQTKITHEQVDKEMARRLATQNRSLKEDERHLLRKHVVSIMIERELLKQAAEASSVNLSQEEIDKTLNFVKEQKSNEGTWDDFLKSNLMDEKMFRAMIRDDLLVSKYINTVVFSSINVSPEEVERAYKSNPERFKVPVEVRARHVLIRLADDADESQVAAATAKAQKVLNAARSNSENFDQLAKEFSEGPTRAKGGDLGYFTENQMVPEFSEAAFALQPGEISDIIRSQFGLHIIKVEERRGGKLPPLDEIKDSIKSELIRQRQKSLLSQHLEQLKGSNKVIQYVN